MLVGMHLLAPAPITLVREKAVAPGQEAVLLRPRGRGVLKGALC
jgi:hypothetical protein